MSNVNSTRIKKPLMISGFQFSKRQKIRKLSAEGDIACNG